MNLKKNLKVQKTRNLEATRNMMMQDALAQFIGDPPRAGAVLARVR